MRCEHAWLFEYGGKDVSSLMQDTAAFFVVVVAGLRDTGKYGGSNSSR
jgi:hypothetical protein